MDREEREGKERVAHVVRGGRREDSRAEKVVGEEREARRVRAVRHVARVRAAAVLVLVGWHVYVYHHMDVLSPYVLEW